MVQSVFGAWDYAIMAATMVASIAIGLYFRFSGGKQATNEEYLLADRNMSIFPVAVSLMASFMSAITLLGVSAENYYYGMQFVIINISYGIATPIASKLYLPVFFGLQKTSTYEYLEMRFGPHIRMLASLTYTLQMVLYNGIVLYAPAIVLEAVTGLDRLISILVVQRLQTVNTLDRSQWCLWWSWPVLSVLSVVTCISGLGIYAVYKDCDPFISKKISAIDQLMPYYVVEAMGSVPGLAGLFVAGIFSASLSTISASCNALAAVTLHDYVGRWWKVPPSYAPWLTKLAACAYGLVFLALAFIAEYLGGVLQAALTIFGAVGGPLLGVFTLGMFTTYANERAVSISLLSGMAMTLWISFGGPRPPVTKLPLSVEGCGFNVTTAAVAATNPSDYFYLYRISYMWTSPIGFIWVIVVGTAVSLLWRQQQPWERQGRSHPDPELFTPPLASRLRARHEEKPAVQMTPCALNTT